MGQVLSAKLETAQDSLDQRIAVRRHLSLQVAGSIESDEGFNATVRDLSQSGFLMDSSISLTRGEMIYVEFPRRGRVPAQVAWTDGRLTGCRFLSPISSGSISAALLGALPEPRPALAGAASAQLASATDDELSLRQKVFAVLGLATLAWATLLVLAYFALHLL